MLSSNPTSKAEASSKWEPARSAGERLFENNTALPVPSVCKMRRPHARTYVTATGYGPTEAEYIRFLGIVATANSSEPHNVPRIPYVYSAAGESGVGEKIRACRVKLNAPDIASGCSELVGAIREKTEIADAPRELLVLRLLALNNYLYEWYKVHESLGRTAGVTPVQISAISNSSATTNAAASRRDFFPPLLAAALDFSDASSIHVKVPQSVFNGVKEMVEVTVIVGVFDFISRFCVALDVAEVGEENLSTVEGGTWKQESEACEGVERRIMRGRKDGRAEKSWTQNAFTIVTPGGTMSVETSKTNTKRREKTDEWRRTEHRTHAPHVLLTMGTMEMDTGRTGESLARMISNKPAGGTFQSCEVDFLFEKPRKEDRIRSSTTKIRESTREINVKDSRAPGPSSLPPTSALPRYTPADPLIRCASLWNPHPHARYGRRAEHDKAQLLTLGFVEAARWRLCVWRREEAWCLCARSKDVQAAFAFRYSCIFERSVSASPFWGSFDYGFARVERGAAALGRSLSLFSYCLLCSFEHGGDPTRIERVVPPGAGYVGTCFANKRKAKVICSAVGESNLVKSDLGIFTQYGFDPTPPISLFALQPSEPTDSIFAVRKQMADG
ncbi:hypothetical protein DFH09DRAFT_1069451 [Mycena vulgaris]|nr:hypothetical protein DFH09DRAFT_1069451 [Mycena vulgaris]